MAIKRTYIKWGISNEARKGIADDVKTLGPELYRETREGIRQIIRSYIEEDQCLKAVYGLSPIDGAPPGMKAFKMRAPRFGGAKRGGYRMILVMDCAAQHVVVQAIVIRRDGISDEEAKEAAARGLALI